MDRIGLESPRSAIAHSLDDAMAAVEEIGLPAIIRPSFTLGGTGGGIAYNREEFEAIVRGGLEASPTNEVLIEESVLGWKEYEMEVVRDKADNAIIICSIENVDPMGIHTGDSITVAPALTLTDKEYQIMRNASIAVLREIGVETGGSNVQFAVNPKPTGASSSIEMNPRVSRSSALASKATGSGSAVDVNQIPFAAIERVEVLKDGASAIYGTDAIGGVINFITKKDFTGLSLNGFVDITEAGGGNIYRLSGVAGYGDLDEQGFNIMGAVSYSWNKILRGSDRRFVNGNQPNRGLSIDTRGTPIATVFNIGTNAIQTPTGTLLSGLTLTAPNGANAAAGGINILDLPGGAGCDSVDGGLAYDEVIWSNPSAVYACAWDTGRSAVIQQPIETLTYYGRAVGRIVEDHEISLEITGSKADSAKSFPMRSCRPTPPTCPGLTRCCQVRQPNITRFSTPFALPSRPTRRRSMRAMAGRFRVAGAVSPAVRANMKPRRKPSGPHLASRAR